MVYKSAQSDVSRLEALFGAIDFNVAKILDKALSEEDISANEGAILLETTGQEYTATCAAADWLRVKTNGSLVTYVVNRNINFTNVCIKRCGFCA
ncbi:MAG: 7,8-didemethyl-8-hydroxy-5-deazariboflavin synthase subunit CofH, partial [SAR202 cluster bacterium]|nr:7,8-didemethyl-8-hydroxy-5-deazariboflavin synthase subunit CofH [SAR202 cluster bacterium]